MFKLIRVRIYPSKEQEKIINQHLGNCRFIYNYCLEFREKIFSKNKEVFKSKILHEEVRKLRKSEGTKWLDNVNSKIYQKVIENLDNAYKNFFKHYTNFPKFKSKKNKQTFGMYQDGISKNFLRENKIFINGQLNNLKFKTSKEYLNILQNNRPRQATFIKSKTNKFFISFLFNLNPTLKQRLKNEEIGIDLGVANFVVCSNGEYINQPNWVRDQNKKIKRIYRIHSKKKLDSKNREKARLKIANHFEKIENKKRDYFYKLANKICSENQTVYLENLNVRGMVKNHKLAKSIEEKSFGRWKVILKQVAKSYNTKIIEIPRFYPSSKICSNCGNYKNVLKLSERIYQCDNCKIELNRDYNAAINIFNEGKKISTAELSETLKEIS